MSWSAPPTLTVGAPAQSSWMNTYVVNNLAYLYGDTSWTVFPYASGWSSLGLITPGYRRMGTRVLLRGSVQNASLAVTAGTAYTLGTLPSGYQPTAEGIVPAWSQVGSSSTEICRVDLMSSGAINGRPVASGTGFNVSLDGISFDLIA